ncbi:hypothetical protein EH223_02920 [candidate division KSB1 bacterium]|nr:hypothetical protein [candidate division KSB1 bacterium]RQW06093.1 MAG: hypothetical protein EH223_02920 [candidate division KSB1 bacterium]
MKLCIKIALFFSLLLVHCDNPFGKDEIKGDNRSISGVVSVSGSRNAAGVYVWLDILNIGNFTDESGAFTLILPPSSTLNSTGKVTGDFDLYFYTINHKLVTKKIIFRDGSVVYGSGDVDANGTVHNISLFRTFYAETRATFPLPSNPGEQYGLSVTGHFKSSSGSCQINIPNGSMIFLGAIFIIDVESGQVYKHQLASGRDEPFIVTLTQKEQIYAFHPSVGSEITFNKDYIVIPYIFPHHPDVPSGLLATLGISEYEINEKYLSLLFSGTFGTFRRPEED